MWKIIIGKEIFSIYIWFLRESEIDRRRRTIVSFFEVNKAQQNGLLLSSSLNLFFFHYLFSRLHY
jgi:replication initiation and membrane attachment protein DnaB